MKGFYRHFSSGSSSISAVLLLAVLVSALLSACAAPRSKNSDSEKARKVDFVTEVKPILQERCVMCHNRATLPKRTSFENGKLALKGDDKGAVILPKDAAGSRFLVAISVPDFHENAMPPVSYRVSKKEIALLTRWINEGAEWPKGAAGTLVPKDIPKE